jgi:HAD superfamily 5'-nucleotidase-like hydrolase
MGEAHALISSGSPASAARSFGSEALASEAVVPTAVSPSSTAAGANGAVEPGEGASAEASRNDALEQASAPREVLGFRPPRTPEQLLLPLANVAPPERVNPVGVAIEPRDRVYVNRDLNLSKIDWLGFDMDYTLAIYHQQALDDLSVRLTVERMIDRGYPRFLRHIRYDTRFPIRGLHVDKRYGNVLKMNRFKVVYKGYHGLARLKPAQIHELYVEKQVRPNTPRYHWIDTLFSLCEVTSYCAIIDALDKHGGRVDYGQVFDDVRKAIDEAHRDGDFYASVTGDLPQYVQRDDELEATLHKFRSAGKKIFLLTNSPWSYTDTLMTYLFGARRKEYPTWRHYFDAVIVAAQKPNWFREGRTLMERERDTLKDVGGKIDRGRIYEGGNLAEFERLLGIRGSSVLYVGDHIYGDILRSKKESTWRTAMIIPELGAEVAAHASCAGRFSRLRELEASRERLEDELRFYQQRFRSFPKAPADATSSLERARIKRAMTNIRGELRAIELEHQSVAEKVDAAFHPYWGSLLKEAGDRSNFGVQVATYADIYMRSVSSLRHYSPLQHFRSPRDLMPHEL